MKMAGNMIKQVALKALVASVLAVAALCMFAVMLGGWDEWWVIKPLLTCLVLTGASICVLICAVYMQKLRRKALPAIGMVLCCGGALLVTGGMWTEAGSDWYWQHAAVVSIFGVAVSHFLLLGFARLKRDYEWVRSVAAGAIFGTAGLLAFVITVAVAWQSGDVAEMLFRPIAALSILAAAMSLVIPVLHVLSGRGELVSADVPAENSGAFGLPDALCPCCARRVALQPEDTTCPNCGCIFNVKVMGEVTAEKGGGEGPS